MARRQWNNGQVATLTKAVNPNMAQMALQPNAQADAGVRAFPLLDAINAATGEIVANGGLGGGGGFQALPRDPRDDNAFGPMDPLTPDAIDLLDSDGQVKPRSWQYTVGWNLPGSGQRETPWQVLRAAAAGVGIIRRCIEVRKKDVRTLKFAFSPSEDAINDAYLENPGAGRLDAEQRLRDELLPEMKRMREFWLRPWRSKSWDFQRWANAAMEEILVIDGVPVYPNRTYGGDVYDLEIIDPTTIKPLLDVRGNQPVAPFPAFQQILYGFPRGEWAASTEIDHDELGNEVEVIRNGFGSAEMLYYVSNTRTYSPYGMSPVEMCLFDSRLYLQRMKWMLAEYDDGSTPLTWVETAAPTDGQQMTLAQQRLWEKALNAKLSGNTRERARVKVLPNGWKAMQMTSVDERYKPEYDLYLIKLLASYFGVTATRLGFGESNGLGGSGFHEGQMEVSGELGLRPDTEVLTAIINEASCKFLGMDPRIKGMFVDPAEANTAEQAAVIVGKVNSAQISINEARQTQGQSLLPFEEANMPFILGGPNGIIFLEGAKASIEAAEAQKQIQAETQALGTAGKLSLDEKKLDDGKEARKEEHDFQREQTEAAAQQELKKAAEIDAFRRWRRKHGDSPRRPFLFKSVEPDDGWGELENLGPELVDYEGWEWISGEDIDKAAKRGKADKSPFDWLGWNAANPLHPKGPNGRWVKRGSDLHTALVEEGERHAKANAPKTGAVSGASTTLQGMKPIIEPLSDARKADLRDQRAEAKRAKVLADLADSLERADLGTPASRRSMRDEAADLESKAVARQARIDAAKAKAGFLADVEEGINTGADSATLRRMTEQALRRGGLEGDQVAGFVSLEMDQASLNTAAAAWGLRRIGDEGSFDPAMHSPVGDRPSVGGDVELVRPGYVMRDGDEDIQIMRAVVDARVSEPEKIDEDPYKADGNLLSPEADASLEGLIDALPPKYRHGARKWAKELREGNYRAATTTLYDFQRKAREGNVERGTLAPLLDVHDEAQVLNGARAATSLLREDAGRLGEEFRTLSVDESLQLGFNNRTGGLDKPEQALARLVELRRSGRVLPPFRMDGEDGVIDNPEAAPVKPKPQSLSDRNAREERDLRARQSAEWKAWALGMGGTDDKPGPVRPITAYTIQASETGTGKEKLGMILPERNANVVRIGRKVHLLDSTTDETLFTGSSMPDLYRQVSVHYGAMVRHEHEGTHKVTRYGTSGDPLSSPAAQKHGYERPQEKPAVSVPGEDTDKYPGLAAPLGSPERMAAAQARNRDDAREASNLALERARQESVRTEARERFNSSNDPRDNGPKVKALMSGTIDAADLYRKTEAGPSGQRRNTYVGRVRFRDNQHGEFQVVDKEGRNAGWMTRVNRNGEEMYVVHSEDYDGGIHLEGWADSVSLGADVLVNGKFAATGRHDSRRISAGKFEAYVPKTEEQLDREEGARNREYAERRASRKTTSAPLIDPGSFVTSPVNAYSLKRGDMIIVDGEVLDVSGVIERPGGRVAVQTRDRAGMGRELMRKTNEPVARVTGGRAGGGGISKAADVGPGGADPKDQEPVTAPPPDQAWPGWLMDTIIASLIAQQLMAAMTGPGLAISGLLHDFLAWTQGYRPGDPMPDVNAWLRTTAPGEPLQAIVDAITPVIRDAHIEGAHVGQRAAQAVLEYVQDGGDLGADRDPALTLSVDWGSWEPGHPEAARALLDPNGLERLLYQSNVIIKGIASNRLDAVGRILGEGLARGDAPAKIGQALRELGKDPVWAHMTALTETNRAMSFAAGQSYIDAGLKYKGWMTAFDQRVCKICDKNAHHADGKPRIVPISMLFPSGDPWPPGHPRCRCAPIPILAMDFAKALNVAQWNVQNPKHPKAADGRWGETPGSSVIRSVLADAGKIGDLRAAFEKEAKRITGNRIYCGLQGNVDTAREHAEGVLRGLERFPDVRLQGVSVKAGDAGVYASAGGRWIRFNYHWTASKKARAEYLASLAAGADGWDEPRRMYGEWVPTDFHVRNSHSPMSVAIHEFGHILDIDTLNERIRDDMDALIERRRVELSRQIMVNRADVGLDTWDLSSSEVIEREVSGYAKKDRRELTAEAFTDVILNGDKASVLSRGIFDLLVTEYERWNT